MESLFSDTCKSEAIIISKKDINREDHRIIYYVYIYIYIYIHIKAKETRVRIRHSTPTWRIDEIFYTLSPCLINRKCWPFSENI